MKGKPPALTAGEQVSFVKERPLPPDFLDKGALKCWDHMAAHLEKAGILVAVSRDKLSRYCMAYSDYAEVVAHRNARGKNRHVIKYKRSEDIVLDDHQQLSYWQRVLEQSNRIMSDFETEYGLTPAAATKVRRSYGGAGTPGQELDKFLET